MKRFTAGLFLFIYLVANTELHQVMRLPVFFAHYVEHQMCTPEISLIEFIVLHYFDDDTDKTDYLRDQQLPFKKANCPEVSIALDLPPEEFPESKGQTFRLSKKRIIFQSVFNSSSFHFSIWQPPRA